MTSKVDDRHPLDIERTLDTMRELRERLNMSQRELAELMGVPQTYISKWENKVVAPRWPHLIILWRILHGLRIEAEVRL